MMHDTVEDAVAAATSAANEARTIIMELDLTDLTETGRIGKVVANPLESMSLTEFGTIMARRKPIIQPDALPKAVHAWKQITQETV